MSFAGIARTDVAVGTVSDASIAWTTRADTPRIGSSVDAEGVTNVGIGFTTGSAGSGVGFCGCVMAGVTVSVTCGAGGVMGVVDGAGVET